MLPKYRMTRGRPQISGCRLLRPQVLLRRHPRAPATVLLLFAGFEVACHIGTNQYVGDIQCGGV